MANWKESSKDTSFVTIERLFAPCMSMDAHPQFGCHCLGACVAFVLCHSCPESCHILWELARTHSQDIVLLLRRYVSSDAEMWLELVGQFKTLCRLNLSRDYWQES